MRFSPGAVEVRCSPSVIGTEMMDGRPLNSIPRTRPICGRESSPSESNANCRFPPRQPNAADHPPRDARPFRRSAEPEEIAAFIADNAPTAQAALVKRLADRPGMAPFTGTLPPGDIQFRVLPVDPDAAKRPRVATGPG